MIEAPLLTSKI